MHTPPPTRLVLAARSIIGHSAPGVLVPQEPRRHSDARWLKMSSRFKTDIDPIFPARTRERQNGRNLSRRGGRESSPEPEAPR